MEHVETQGPSGPAPPATDKGVESGAAKQTADPQSRPRDLVVKPRAYKDDGADLSDDSDLRSSPARGAAMALASMGRQKPDYAFPLKDDGNVELTPEANGTGRGQRKRTGAAIRRDGEEYDDAEDGEEDDDEGAQDGRGKRKSKSGFYPTQPQFRKKERKSAPFSSPSSDQIQAMWGARQAIADPLVPVRSMPVEIAITEPGDKVSMSVYPGPTGAAGGGSAPDLAAPPKTKSSMGPPADKPSVAAASKAREEEPGPAMGVIFSNPVQGFSPDEQYEGLSAVGAVRFDRPYVPGPPPQAHPQGPGPAYNRKDKSLGLLCENFMRRFSDPNLQDPEVGISLDKAANILGVERRRIYDIINILESICYVSRKCKNTYSWHGHIFLDDVLKLLQDEALAMWPEDAVRNGLIVPPDHSSRTAAPTRQTTPWPGHGSVGPSLPDPNAAMADERKEKSLGRLSQKFIQLFLIGYQVISLAGAAEKLLGAVPGPQGTLNDRGMKTKVRRLYDIANVLTSLRLIDKIQVADSRKPSFRWVGVHPQALMARPSPKVDMPGNIFPGVPGLTVSAKQQHHPVFQNAPVMAPLGDVLGSSHLDLPQQSQEGSHSHASMGFPGPESMFPSVPGGLPPYAAGAPAPPFAHPPGAFNMYHGSESVYPHWGASQETEGSQSTAHSQGEAAPLLPDAAPASCSSNSGSAGEAPASMEVDKGAPNGEARGDVGQERDLGMGKDKGVGTEWAAQAQAVGSVVQ